MINGTIIGPVQADELLELHPNAQVSGEVRYRAIEMHHGAVRDHHTLRRSSRARRVDHVGAALRIDRNSRRHSRLPRDRRLIAVQAHHAVDAAGIEPRA